TPGEHSRNGAMVSNFRDKRKILFTEHPTECFSIIDHMPLAFVIVELVHEGPQMMRLYIRFCSREAGKILRIDPGLVVGEPLRKVFPFIRDNLVIKVGDIAANGGCKDMIVHDSRIDHDFYVRCFQTKNDFCAAMMIDIGSVDEADRI
ncbi:MAG: hypothetical protein ACI38Y_04705, partial [Candidatus Methanomethylophilaceae archaeon]